MYKYCTCLASEKRKFMLYTKCTETIKLSSAAGGGISVEGVKKNIQIFLQGEDVIIGMRSCRGIILCIFISELLESSLLCKFISQGHDCHFKYMIPTCRGLRNVKKLKVQKYDTKSRRKRQKCCLFTFWLRRLQQISENIKREKK